MLSAFRQLAVGTLLGPEKEKEINWYLQAGHKEELIGQLTSKLIEISKIVLHCATSVSVHVCLTFAYYFITLSFIIVLICLNRRWLSYKICYEFLLFVWLVYMLIVLLHFLNL